MALAQRIFFDSKDAPAPVWARVLTCLLLALGLALLCWMALAGATGNWAAIWSYRGAFFRGWLVTVAISAAALTGSTLAGLLVALCGRSHCLPLKSLAAIYVEWFRGTPFLVQLLFGFYVAADALGLSNRLIVGSVILTLFSSAYISEMLRAGFESVSASQRESARAIGLTPLHTFRFIVLPQAARQTIPPLAGQFASIIKDSSLLSILGIEEFTLSAQQVNSATFSTLESYLPLALGYLVLTFPISMLSRFLEERFRYET